MVSMTDSIFLLKALWCDDVYVDRLDMIFLSVPDFDLSISTLESSLMDSAALYCSTWRLLKYAGPRTSQTADPGVASSSSIPAQPHTFLEIDHKIIFYRHSPPSAHSRVTSKSKCMKYWLITLSNLPRKKCYW